MKKTIVIIFTALILIYFSSCSQKEWTYSADHVIKNSILSPNGEEYVFWSNDRFINGLTKDKKLGKLLPKYTEDIASVYSIKGANDDRFVITFYENEDEMNNKYHATGLDGGIAYSIFVKSSDEFYDIKNTNISAISFIPNSDRNENTDYFNYVFENGIVGNEAKSLLDEVYNSKLDKYSVTEEFVALGSLSYFPDDVDWFCFSASVMYTEDQGYFIIIADTDGYEYYALSEHVVDALEIDINKNNG